MADRAVWTCVRIVSLKYNIQTHVTVTYGSVRDETATPIGSSTRDVVRASNREDCNKNVRASMGIPILSLIFSTFSSRYAN